MELKDLLATKPDELAAKQEKELATYAAKKLRMIADHLEAGRYDQVREHLADSPAGDDHGCDNTYITFAELGIDPDRYGNDNGDIGSVVSKLEELKKLAKGKNK